MLIVFFSPTQLLLSIPGLPRDNDNNDNRFEDIADPAFSPDRNEGITFEEAMATIHVIQAKDKKILTGMDALTSLYDITGMGWLFKLAKLPVLSSAAEIAYKVVSKNRTSMGGAADSLLALGRINMEEKGEGSCTDLEGECREKAPPVDEEADKAAAAAEERRAKMAAEKEAKAEAAGAAGESGAAGAKAGTNPAQATSKGGLETASREPAAVTSGSLSDRRNILGVYDMRRSKSDARALRAAPVDTVTGELIDELITIPLEDSELSTVAAALTSIIKHFGWQGNVGIGLPGRVVKTDENPINETMDTMDDDDLVDVAANRSGGNARLSSSLASRAAEVSTSADSRNSRLEMESYLKNAIGRDVVAMAGAEATGFGEMFYGAGNTDKGVSVCVTLGLGIGVSLFDEGVLAHNPEDVERQLATWSFPRWDNHELPRLPMLDGEVDPTEEEWERWAERVDHYLQRIEAVCKPDNFIVCGRASVSFDKWASKMKNVKTPVICAQQGLTAAVQGAAQGAHEILTLRRDTARVRAAIGHAKGLSPQKLNDEQLGAVFQEFDKARSRCRLSSCYSRYSRHSHPTHLYSRDAARLTLVLFSNFKPLIADRPLDRMINHACTCTPTSVERRLLKLREYTTIVYRVLCEQTATDIHQRSGLDGSVRRMGAGRCRRLSSAPPSPRWGCA